MVNNLEKLLQEYNYVRIEISIEKHRDSMVIYHKNINVFEAVTLGNSKDNFKTFEEALEWLNSVTK